MASEYHWTVAMGSFSVGSFFCTHHLTIHFSPFTERFYTEKQNIKIESITLQYRSLGMCFFHANDTPILFENKALSFA